MNGWLILLAVLLSLCLLGQLRIGCGAAYSAAGPEAWIRLWMLRLQLYPPKKKAGHVSDKSGKTESTKTVGEDRPAAEKLGSTLSLIRELLPLALEAANCFPKKLRVDELSLRLTVGAEDPAEAAIWYGRANALLGSIWIPLTETFSVVDGSAKVQLDFDATVPTLYGNASLSLKLGQILWLGLHFGSKALLAFIKHRRQEKQHREAV